MTSPIDTAWSILKSYVTDEEIAGYPALMRRLKEKYPTGIPPGSYQYPWHQEYEDELLEEEVEKASGGIDLTNIDPNASSQPQEPQEPQGPTTQTTLNAFEGFDLPPLEGQQQPSTWDQMKPLLVEAGKGAAYGLGNIASSAGRRIREQGKRAKGNVKDPLAFEVKPSGFQSSYKGGYYT